MMIFHGNKFNVMWKSVDIFEMKQMWAEELSAYSDKPNILKYALEETEKQDWPPSLSDFLSACRDYKELIQSCAKCSNPPHMKWINDWLCYKHFEDKFK